METVIAASLKLNTEQATQPVKAFRQQLKEAQGDLLNVTEKFGATSKEAANAAKRVAELRDRMGDANTLVDAFNPDAKFKGFGNVVQSVAGGFSALTGTMALFGVEGEHVEKTLLKVQAAMAISQGINSVLEGADAFKAFGTQIRNTTVVQKTFAASTAIASTATKALGLSVNTTSTGFKILRGAIIATGIGALAVGLGYLVSNFDKVKKVVLNLIPGLSGVADFIGKIANSVTDFVGATSEAGRQMGKTIKGLERSIGNSERFLELNADKYDQYTKRKIDADLDYQKKKLGFLKDEELTETQRNNLIKQAEEQRSRLIKEASEDRAGSEKKITDDLNKSLSDKAKQRADQERQAAEQASSELRSLQQGNYLANIADERKRAEEAVRIDYENSVREVKSLTVADDLKTELLTANETKRQIALKAVKVEFDAKDIEDQKTKDAEKAKATQEAYDLKIAIIKDNEQKVLNALKEDELDGTVSPEDAARSELEILRASLQAQYDLTAEYGFNTLELETQIIDAKVAAQKTAKDSAIAFDEAEKDSKLKLWSAIGSGFGALAGLLGEQTKAGKAAALAEIAINTGVGISSALRIAQRSAEGTGPGAVFAFPIFFATQIAAVLGAASRAKSILSAGSGASAPLNPTNVQAPLKPQPPQETNTRLPQDQINQMGSAASPVRAFIVEKDVANNQERITRLNRAARLGG